MKALVLLVSREGCVAYSDVSTWINDCADEYCGKVLRLWLAQPTPIKEIALSEQDITTDNCLKGW